MNRETIEQAALELCTTEGQEEWLKDYGKNCFMDGARWRINSVWHDAREKPEFGGEAGRWIVMYFEHGMLSTTFARKDEWHELRKHNNFTRWAYQTDLMPDRKKDKQ